MSRARKFWALLALLVVSSLVLSACGPKTAPAPQGGSPSTPAAKKPAVGSELNLRLRKDPDSLNPIMYTQVYGQRPTELVYAQLFRFNEKLEPTPYVAETWSASPDGLTWTFNLRQGIKFHDGNELTADDVVFTFTTIQHKDYTGPRSGSVTDIKSVTAKDKYTVVLELKQPSAPLLTNINFGILEKKLFEGVEVAKIKEAPASLKPIGAGPYKFVDFKWSQYLILERNDDWFMSKELNGAPFAQKITFKIIPDDTTALAALENGEIDHDTPLPNEVTRLIKEHKEKLTPVNYERNGWGFMTLNIASPKLAEKRVRHALTYALDRESIITGAMDGRGVIPAGPIPPVSWAYDPSIKPLPFDPDKAKALLDEAGWKVGADGFREKDGERLKLSYYATSGSPLTSAIAEIAKKNWKDVGVDVDIALMDLSAMTDNYLAPGKFDVAFSGITLGNDPDQYDMWHSSQIPRTPTSKTFNRGRYSNADVDRLLEQGRQETEMTKRKAIYSEFQKQFVEDAPVILIYANKYTDMVSTRIKGGVTNFPGTGADPIFAYNWYLTEQ